MNRRQFFIALAVLAILAAAGAAVVLSDRSAWTAADSRAGQKAIPGLRLSEVAEIAIRDSSGELHLVRGETGWSVCERGRPLNACDHPGRIVIGSCRALLGAWIIGLSGELSHRAVDSVR